jgi:hypothetical protein
VARLIFGYIEKAKFMKSQIISAVLLAFFGFLTPTVQAGSITDAAAEAESLADEGKALDAILAMDVAVQKLWDKVEFNFIDVLFVEKPPEGYGIYEPRANHKYKSGDDMILYMELVGYKYVRDGIFFKAELKADMQVKDSNGKVLGAREDFVTLNMRSRVPAREFFGVITYNFDPIGAGDYVLTTKLKDQFGTNWVSVDKKFTIE